MTVVIGLTGSIGTGKSTIAKRLEELGAPIVDADLIAREVVEPGKTAHQKIVAAFGEKVLHEDGSLNRTVLGNIVFQDEAKRKQLNEIIHPEIRKEMLRQRDELVSQNISCVIMDIPLLFESKLMSFVDKILVVSLDKEKQLSRILARDQQGEEEARKRIASQIPVSEKAAQADAVIDNNGSKEASFQQLEDILDTWDIFIEDKSADEL